MAYSMEEMNGIRSRVEMLRKEKGLSKNSMAVAIGLKSKSNFCAQLVEDSSKNLSNATMRLICKTFGVSHEWLEKGVGEMYDAPEAEDLMKSFDAAFAMNGNNSPNVTQMIGKKGETVQAVENMLLQQIKDRDKEIERLNARVDKLLDLIEKMGLNR